MNLLIISLLVFVIIMCSIGIGIDIWYTKTSCDDNKEPNNLDVCKDDGDIDCICEDKSDYIKRWWKPFGASIIWIYLYIIIVCIIIIIIIIIISPDKETELMLGRDTTKGEWLDDWEWQWPSGIDSKGELEYDKPANKGTWLGGKKQKRKCK